MASRRFWLFVHDVLVHPVIGIWKALSPSTMPRGACWLHDATVPPMREVDRRWREPAEPAQ